MHNKRLARDDVLKIEVSSSPYQFHVFGLTRCSGPALLHLPHGASIPAVNVSVLQLHVALLLAVVVALHLLDVVVVVAVVTTLPVRMRVVVTETTIVVAVIALAVQRIG